MTLPECSRITGGPTDVAYQAKVLDKYEIQYFRCRETGFIQTETPYWLDEAYQDAITAQDSGLLQRCITYADIMTLLIKANFQSQDRYLDFGGGYGVFTRLMRDRGLNYFHCDPHCQNLFAKEFEVQVEEPGKYRLVTAFEVFEHLVDPAKQLKQLLELADTVVFSTLIVPEPPPKDVDEWWYFLPQSGQHVSLYTVKSLDHLAGSHGATLYTNGKNLHCISRRPIDFSIAGDNLWAKLRRRLHRVFSHR
ncbi:class I SAM-dependent methyltransferase [Stieleria sp. ICT_E10.1]|uniref:class I SAM-dependent methyltransferase n=1 Tax=Stieleria sedimenti TaxID=2976331 RepID=UPI00217F8242|nr:class I SAM-dependent methyltransferase [Stieleria sedimenti]MCS7465468.1 class I SAM-dependent methyltransferase [Stieleria sedimenti]